MADKEVEQQAIVKGTNREVYAEVYLSLDETPHYVLPNKGYGQNLATQIGSRNMRGVQAVPAYDKDGNSQYIIADNIAYFIVKREKDTDLNEAIMSLPELKNYLA